MSNILDILTRNFGMQGDKVMTVILAVMTVFGVIVTLAGRRVMVWLVSVCGMLAGMIAGAMIGLLIFDSFIIMIILALLCAAAMAVLIGRTKRFGYFIGMTCLSFFTAYIITSDMCASNAQLTEGTLVLIDMIIAVVSGLLAAVRSRYVVSFITSVSGGMIVSISVLALMGAYFSDWRTWTLAAIAAAAGMCVQVYTYDVKAVKHKHRKH